MPTAWSPKDERQYKHIVKSCRRGKKACKRIAASTVNKRRREQGRTLGEFHVEFKARPNDSWNSACETWPERSQAKRWIKDSVTELKAEGNSIGKFKIVEGPSRGGTYCGRNGPGASSAVLAVALFPWITVLTAGYFLFKDKSVTV